MHFLELLQCFSKVLMTFVSLYYWYQIGYLLLAHLRPRRARREQTLKSYAILIAARNEEQVLPHLLQSIRAQNYPQDKLGVYVVADNCTDDTARVARENGAQVLERFDTQRLGKGYALHDLIGYIRRLGELEQYDAFLVFDADNLLAQDYVMQMNRLCCDGYEAFCGYRNSKNFGTNWLTSGYSLMFLHDCMHMNRARMNIGSSCIVSGTGFGFTRSVLERSGDWSFFTLTEDTQFSYWCAANNIRVAFCPEAMVYDEQPTTFRQSWNQRVRWVQGSFQVAMKSGAMLCKGLLRGSYACYECLTMSLWGYGLAAVSFLLQLLCVLLLSGAQGFALTLCNWLGNMYASLFVIGALTLLTQWKRIPATRGRKLCSLFTFPLFMLTFIPVAIAAPFTKFQWKPIRHSVAISAESLLEK